MLTEGLLLPALMAAVAGLVGCFAVMRRMVLAGDAFSHVALPGIGIALALHIHPLFGAITMLFFGALLVWTLERRTRIATETIIGVVFSAALAIGSLLTSGEDLLEALVGHSGMLSWPETVFGLAASIVIATFILRQRHKLVIALVSPDIALTAGINVRRLDLIYLEVFALTVALGIRFLGVLLMGSLIIIPAATAKRLSSNLNSMLIIAAAIGAGATLVGSALALYLHREPGPVIVAIAAAGFMATTLRHT